MIYITIEMDVIQINIAITDNFILNQSLYNIFLTINFFNVIQYNFVVYK